MMLKIADPLACSCCGNDPAESADNGVIMKGCPTARTSCDQRNCWMPQSCVRNEFIKQLTANMSIPKATIKRGSTRRMTNGTSGKIASCGRPIHITTSPICIAS